MADQSYWIGLNTRFAGADVVAGDGSEDVFCPRNKIVDDGGWFCYSLHQGTPSMIVKECKKYPPGQNTRTHTHTHKPISYSVLALYEIDCD